MSTESLQLQRVGLPKRDRPAEISVWIQYARNRPISVDNAASYVRKWWLWWSGINPSWRTRVDGRPQRGGSGDWSSLLKSGINGFLTVLASLVALRDAADEDGWRDAMEDVDWVLKELVIAASNVPPPYVLFFCMF